MSDEQTPGVEDFDAFWDTRNATGKSVKIRGHVITLPASLPLQFELEARKLQRSKRDQDVRKLVGLLYGADAYERFAEAGMDLDQLKVLLAWGAQTVAGEDVSFEAVAREVLEAETEADPT